MHTHTAVDCGPLDAPALGAVNLNRTTFGSIANYSCQTGYEVNGTSTRVCGGNGEWSGSMPQCLRKSSPLLISSAVLSNTRHTLIITAFNCGSLMSPSNGIVTIINGTSFPDGRAVYVCDVGFSLVRPALRTCLPDGWSGEEPVCEGNRY